MYPSQLTQEKIASALQKKLHQLANVYEEAHDSFMRDFAVSTRTARENSEHQRILELTQQLSS